MMTPDDLRSELLRLNTVEESASARAFVERLPSAAALQFFRPFRDDVVLAASVRNGPERLAFAIGVQVLDTLEQRWDELKDREVTKLAPWNAGPDFADALLVLGRDIAKVAPTKGYVFPSRTVAGYPINHIEFTGEETAAEAIVRKKEVHLNDLTRVPSPVVFGRYQLQNGEGSARHFAVAPLSTILTVLRSVVREGGRLEIENYERQRCLLTASPAATVLEFRTDDIVRQVSCDEGEGLIRTLTHLGADALRRELETS